MYKKNIFPILKSLKKTKNVMIIFHGYGSNGNQIINIAKYWQAFLPNTIFIAPNGLKSCYNNKYGHKWFNIENYNLKYKNLYNKNYKIYITKIKIYINYILYKYKLLTLKLFFSGFSQGAILALRLGLEYKNNLGIISYSGAFIHEKKFKPKVKIPIILIHGKKDKIIPYLLSKKSNKNLLNLGINITKYSYKSLGHSISESGIIDGLAFLYLTN